MFLVRCCIVLVLTFRMKKARDRPAAVAVEDNLVIGPMLCGDATRVDKTKVP